MIRLLVATTLYPNEVEFRHGIFVETRLRRLLASGGYSAVVIAPVPWFPLTSRYFPRYSQYARVPRREERFGITVHHPRYLVIPKVGMLLTPFFLALSMLAAARKIRAQGGGFDVVDAHYFYPDGVAAALLARWFARPLVITARGTDINLIADYFLPRRLIRWAASRAADVVAVSGALRDRLVDLGVQRDKIHLVRNGVDLDLFAPLDKAQCKAELGFGARTLLSVGNLVELKGHGLVIRALARLPGFELVIVGEGELRGALEELAREIGVHDRVRFVTAVPQARLVAMYNAADALVLASSREGMPNVVLESLACDTPVVATAVGGVPEVISNPEAGVLVRQRDPEGIADAIRALFAAYPPPGATRRCAEAFSWGSSITQLRHLFERRSAR